MTAHDPLNLCVFLNDGSESAPTLTILGAHVPNAGQKGWMVHENDCWPISVRMKASIKPRQPFTAHLTTRLTGHCRHARNVLF